jgi:hypothetical protein
LVGSLDVLGRGFEDCFMMGLYVDCFGIGGFLFFFAKELDFLQFSELIHFYDIMHHYALPRLVFYAPCCSNFANNMLILLFNEPVPDIYI